MRGTEQGNEAFGKEEASFNGSTQLTSAFNA